MAIVTPQTPDDENQGLTTVTDWCVVENSPVIQVGPEQSQAVVTFLVAWDEMGQFIQEAIGYSYTKTVPVGINTGYVLKRWHPMTYPDFLDVSGSEFMYATRVLDARGVGEFDADAGRAYQWPKYKHGLVTVLFESVLYTVKLDIEINEPGHANEHLRYCLPIEEPKMRQITVEKGMWIWEAAGKDWNAKPVGRGTPFYEPSSLITHRWLDVPVDYPNFALLDSYRGTLNAFEFLNKAIGTLKYNNYRKIPHVTPIGGKSLMIDLEFEWLPNGNFDEGDGSLIAYEGHNGFLALDGKYYPITTQVAGGRGTLYYLTDFRDLFEGNVLP